MKVFDVIALINLVEWTQLKNYRAYLSHRKRKLAILGVTQYVSL
ncbi:MAG: hypothetical protein NTV58_14850 [Deltaproteobacteria bacterium]|nr:hypothetical protein [Deltaproteobacteria bacterium]